MTMLCSLLANSGGGGVSVKLVFVNVCKLKLLLEAGKLDKLPETGKEYCYFSKDFSV